MREIKFRGKSDKYGWVYGNLSYREEDGNSAVFIEDQGFCGDLTPVDRDTIGQYTGLKDANGKEIYEGDIIRVEEYWNELMDIEHEENDFEVFSLEEIKGKKRNEFVSPVIWEDGVFSVYDSEDNGYYLSILAGDMRRSQPIFISTIIGNVYDNPELL